MIFETISDAIKEAMKSRDKVRLDALRMLKSRLLENKTAKSPVAEMDVVVLHHKQLKESMLMFPEGGEHRAKIAQEMAVVEQYMPKAMSKAEVSALIDGILTQDVAANFGAVMRLLSPQIKGRYDGKEASELVKNRLNPSA